ncbi:hypothetical protein TanjilG_06650 [Lupinus angustifolius]|uniref:Bifunctional inhibitor/plant lipid transfer protein/seed storage helical domain-containing protein n=1 Tax=Lupinus angustifolius TaxID=3871 RepID=A0A1J7I5J4_LUPAN|nr:PREDICTED: protein YLS3-like [Lupinus angustifolius]OIW08107.1 hypothetical protein TanjilG_06650 [Lupinus angustifolius]
MWYYNTNSLVYFLLLASIVVGNAMADSSKDKEECTEQLAGLATCLPYVSNEAKAPTPTCCSGLKQVLMTNKKCLCVIINDRNDPDIGSLQINATLALSLPNVCNDPANVSKCPELLHIDPKSTEAQIFYQLNKSSSKDGTSPAPNPSDRGQTSSITQKNDALCKEKRLFGLHIIVAELVIGLLLGL